MRTHANYALCYLGTHLGPERDGLDLDWATFVGDRTETYEFTVPTDDAVDCHLSLQAYDVGEYGHEVLINGESLSGFDIPPAEGWQYWMDSLSDHRLREGTNTVRIVRDTSGTDNFAVGNVKIHWKEPVRE